MRFSDLESYLAQTPLAPLWVITGEEPLLMLEAADLLRAKAREEGATEREVLNASAIWDWSKLPESCTAMSLFGDKKIVELRLASPRPGVKGTQALTDIASMPLDGVTLVVTIPYDWSLKKRPGTRRSPPTPKLSNATAFRLENSPPGLLRVWPRKTSRPNPLPSRFCRIAVRETFLPQRRKC